MSLLQPSWKQPVITGFPAWQTTISSYTTEPEMLTSMQTPCEGILAYQSYQGLQL